MNETNMHWRNEILHMNYETCCRINFIVCIKQLLSITFKLIFNAFNSLNTYFGIGFLPDTDI